MTRDRELPDVQEARKESDQFTFTNRELSNMNDGQQKGMFCPGHINRQLPESK
jgi:hypothetical protein